jgi:RNA polymerase sigma-70 factor (ECF subfamily)
MAGVCARARSPRLACGYRAPRWMSDLDNALLEQICGSSERGVRERAFRELVRRHAGPLQRFLRAYQSDMSARDDLVQETFLRVYQARERFSPASGAFQTWLFTIGRNLAFDARRRERSRPTQALESGMGGVDSGSGPLQALVGAQEATVLRNALELLPEADLEAVRLRFYEDLSYADIAAIVGASPAAVKQRVWRAMGKLRTLLQEERAP